MQSNFGQTRDGTLLGKGIFSQNAVLFFSNERSQCKRIGTVLVEKRDDILIIQNSNLNTRASRHYQSVESTYTEHRQWDNAAGTNFTEVCSSVARREERSGSMNGAYSNVPLDQTEDSEYDFRSEDFPSDTLEETPSTVNGELEDLMGQFKSYKATTIPTVQERIEMVRDLQQKALDYLLRILFGDKPSDIRGCNHIDRKSSPAEQSADNPVTMEGELLGQNLGTGGHHEYFYYYAEKEVTCFNTTGTAITADGRELSFNISLEMSRSFTEMASESIDFGQPRLCDPLVINLNTNVASVSDQKFFFDIDADGEKEEISMLGADNGYLALDNNEDGIINDGSELFGTQSGNGFKDLLAYDEDGNGWIDEADSIFDKLKIWSMDENGNATLIDLLEAGVGAIYLGYENTEFSLKNAENETDAVIQKTGLFLFEDGTAGTVQQMDLAV